MSKRSLFIVLGFFGCVASSAQAGVVELESVISGGFHADGVHFHHHANYHVGYTMPSSPVERRNWFMFNLADVSGPIVGAKLKLWLSGGETGPMGYLSSDPHEEFMISGTPYPWETFMDAFTGSPAITPPIVADMFTTLGVGVPFGVSLIGPGHAGSYVEIEFTIEGLAALNDSIGSPFMVGGRLTDLHIDEPDPFFPAELVFAHSDIPHPDYPMPRLELVVIPAPGSAVAVCLGVLVAPTRRRRG